jgi:1,2-diacylglycerol 3-beta-galactosyltransferase
MAQHRILILMSNTGAGHRISARALQSGFHSRYGSRIHVEIIDLLGDHLPPPLRYVPRTYPFLSEDAPWLWQGLWRVDMRIADPILAATARAARPSMRRVLTTYRPDLVISVHPLVQQMTVLALRQLGQSIPFVTVVTDLATTHPSWFHPAVARCYVAGPEAWHCARSRGLSPDQLRMFGLPIRPEFMAIEKSKPEIRRALGLPHLPAVLLMGGGERVDVAAAMARQTAQALAADGEPRGQLVVICGRNRRLQDALVKEQWPVPTLVLGFEENMAIWMQACDCIVTKAGPGTVAEAMACGLPLILSGYIPGQEAGNVAYVLARGMGRYITDPAAIGEQVAAWFGPHSRELSGMASCARAHAQPHATEQIVADLAGFLS